MISRKKKTALCSFIALILALPRAHGEENGPGRVKRELARVLAQEKFTYHDDGRGGGPGEESILETLMKKIEEKIIAFRDYLAKLLKATSLVAALIYLFILAAVALLAVYVLKRIDPGQRGREKPEATAGFTNLDFERELRRAAGLLEAGKLREALQAMLGALWLYYNYTRVFTYRRSVTNREYLDRLGGREEYGLLRDIVFRGEAAVYAGEEIREDQCREIFRDIKGIIAQ